VFGGTLNLALSIYLNLGHGYELI